MMDKAIGKNEVVIVSTQLGTIKVLSKKKKNYAKEYSMIYPSNIFKSSDTISDLMQNKLFGAIICDSKYLNKNLQKQLKEIKGT